MSEILFLAKVFPTSFAVNASYIVLTIEKSFFTLKNVIACA